MKNEPVFTENDKFVFIFLQPKKQIINKQFLINDKRILSKLLDLNTKFIFTQNKDILAFYKLSRYKIIFIKESMSFREVFYIDNPMYGGRHCFTNIMGKYYISDLSPKEARAKLHLEILEKEKNVEDLLKTKWLKEYTFDKEFFKYAPLELCVHRDHYYLDEPHYIMLDEITRENDHEHFSFFNTESEYNNNVYDFEKVLAIIKTTNDNNEKNN